MDFSTSIVVTLKVMLISVPEGGDVHRTLACVKCVAVAMSVAQPLWKQLGDGVAWENDDMGSHGILGFSWVFYFRMNHDIP